jgi:glc operon protein GlcG
MTSLLALFATSAVAVATAVSSVVVERKSISSVASVRMVAACEAAAEKNGWKLSIAVLDESGNLLTLRRMEGAGVGTIQFAQDKARTALRMGRSTGDVADWVAAAGGRAQIVTNSLNLIAMKGGLPILLDGKVIGAIAASGAQPQQDEECARAGVEAVLPP